MTTVRSGHEPGESIQPSDAQEWAATAAARLGRPFDEVVREAASPLVDQYQAGWGGAKADGRASYVERVARALAYHWWRFEEKGPRSLGEVIGRVRAGYLAYGPVGTDVLNEVVLAEGFGRGEDGAAGRFVAEYVPAIAAAARAAGGERAAQELCGLEAELILPRAGRPARLSLFAGRCPLRDWLRQVVRNEWARVSRGRPVETDGRILSVLSDRAPGVAETLDHRECLELLEPAFRGAVSLLSEDEGLLLRMVLIDQVQQVDLARLWKVNKSTVSRKHQRAFRKLTEAFGRAIPPGTELSDCLRRLIGARGGGRWALVTSIAALLGRAKV